MRRFGGTPEEALPHILERLREAVESRSVQGFYIARTGDYTAELVRRMREWQPPPTELLVLYETASDDHARQVEEELIRVFGNHPKCRNGQLGAGAPSPSGIQYVVALLWSAD